MLKRKNKLPKISIITPSFNQGEFIKRTIKSVLAQDYPNFEYMVMDGGSTDQTLKILEKYEGKIVWQSEEDKGQADAINKGLGKTKGEIFAYLNSDDTYEPGTLRAVASFFLNNPRTMWAFGKCHIIDEKGRRIRKLVTSYKNFWLKRYSFRALLVLNFISQPATFWRRKAYKEIGGFSLHEFWELDYDYWLRLGQKYQPGFIDQYLANFRVHEKAKTSINTKHFLKEIEVAKRYTKNPLLTGLHYLNFLSIFLGYSVLSKLDR